MSLSLAASMTGCFYCLNAHEATTSTTKHAYNNVLQLLWLKTLEFSTGLYVTYGPVQLWRAMPWTPGPIIVTCQ